MSHCAFIFDWDGVIIDSHDAHEQSWNLLAQETGHPLPEGFFKASFGMRNQQIFASFFSWVDPNDHETIAKLGDRKEEFYREIIRKTGITPLPGVRRLLEQANEKGIPCAVGSSTPRKNIDTIMEIIRLQGYFSAICSAEDVTKGKPAPDVFLRAAEKLDAPPSHCLVFEDAHVGIEAGHAAGMKVVAVATTHPIESLHADLVLPDLATIEMSALLALLEPIQ